MSGRDPKLTPGVIDPNLGTKVLCAGLYPSKHRRTATSAEKKSVYAAYGISKLKRILYRLDDIVPLELGGVNTVGNLWPQPILESFAKDRKENELRKLVCNGKMTLLEAQNYFLENW